LHYTVLTSVNALAIGLGGLLGAILGDLLGVTAAYGVSALLCLAPMPLFSRWSDHASASAGVTEPAHQR
jgi:predicted MFS family arabinose efflux permease